MGKDSSVELRAESGRRAEVYLRINKYHYATPVNAWNILFLTPFENNLYMKHFRDYALQVTFVAESQVPSDAETAEGLIRKFKPQDDERVPGTIPGRSKVDLPQAE